jgi:hypothetical protein
VYTTATYRREHGERDYNEKYNKPLQDIHNPIKREGHSEKDKALQKERSRRERTRREREHDERENTTRERTRREREHDERENPARESTAR